MSEIVNIWLTINYNGDILKTTTKPSKYRQSVC